MRNIHLVVNALCLIAVKKPDCFVDSDFAGDENNKKSKTGFVICGFGNKWGNKFRFSFYTYIFVVGH